MRVYAGSYGPHILTLRRDPGSGALSDPVAVAGLTQPSWLARHPRLDVLYAVSETADGAVAAFAFDGAPLGHQPSHGGEPCHAAVDPTGSRLAVANYGGGSIAVYPLAEDGSLGPAERVLFFGEGAHAHQVVFHNGRAIVTDLGRDEIHQFTPDFASSVVSAMPSGCGPRHLVFHPGGHAFATAELSGSVLVLDSDLRHLATVPATHTPVVENAPSGLALSPDARFLYAANRGPNVVTVFSVDGSHLRPLADVPTGGDWPRDLTFIDGHLYVSNQRSDNVVQFILDGGMPDAAGAFPVPRPSCLLAV
jgi:6-phosphogluconolactonase